MHKIMAVPLYNWKQLMYGRNIVAPPGNQAETEKTNLDL
jgi:hypothetical protein